MFVITNSKHKHTQTHTNNNQLHVHPRLVNVGTLSECRDVHTKCTTHTNKWLCVRACVCVCVCLRGHSHCLPVLLVDPAEVTVESRLGVKGLLAARHGALEPLRLAVDGLDVHQQVVSDAEPPSTLLALWCVCVCVC